MMDMKAKVAFFKVRVKEASKVLSVSDIFDWPKMPQNFTHYSDIRKDSGEPPLEDVPEAATRIIYISVN